MDLGISIFLIFVRCVALRNLELLIKLAGTYLSDLLLRTLVVGRLQPSESIEAALDIIWSKGGLMNRFVIGRCYRL